MTIRTGILARLTLLMTALWLALGTAAFAQLEGTITQASSRSFRVAAPDFAAQSSEARQLGDEIAAVVRNDLRSTGLVDLVDPSAFIERDLNVDLQPRFADWKIINTEFLVVGETEILPDGRVRVGFRLWDVLGQKARLLDGQPGRQYVTTRENWRRVAHKIADSIYTGLTGDDGYFDTRIVFIAETGPKTNRRKRLAIMDQDGANTEFLTSGADTVITPRFSPSAQEITYMSYEGGRPRVYLFNIETGRQEVLGNFGGMTFAPRFSPSGNSVVMSQAINGNSDIYTMDLRQRTTRRLTSHPSIDTSPSYSPDGRQIVFTSDRGGQPQLYVMNADGSQLNCPTGGRSDACRVSGFSSGGSYSTPVWSPRGDLIAFTKQSRGRFFIGVVRPDGTGERLLTESYLDEGPDWSPNGRVITFFRETGPGAAPKLYAIDLTGRNLRQLLTPSDASDPAWSPPLP